MKNYLKSLQRTILNEERVGRYILYYKGVKWKKKA